MSPAPASAASSSSVSLCCCCCERLIVAALFVYNKARRIFCTMPEKCVQDASGDSQGYAAAIDDAVGIFAALNRPVCGGRRAVGGSILPSTYLFTQTHNSLVFLFRASNQRAATGKPEKSSREREGEGEVESGGEAQWKEGEVPCLGLSLSLIV